MINEELHKIRKLIYELSPKSSGVQEFLIQFEENPELIKSLGFQDLESIKNYITDGSYDEFQQLKTDLENILKQKNETFEEEMNEIERTVQHLNREEGLNVSVKDLINAFRSSKEITLDKNIWNKLENTESNIFKKGDLKKVVELAKKYGKSNPLKIKKDLLSGEYKRPLILKFNNRYYLVAGNTRLSTAAALGIKPKVFLASI